MKKLSEAVALARLGREKAAFQTHIVKRFEHAARDCKTCPTAGACCTDAHFVNVHVTRLEAVAIRRTLERTPRLDARARRTVYERARAVVARYQLRASGDTYAQTFACPLFEPGVGCLVHRRAKPAPCIQHACYDRWEDVPPVELQWQAERRVEALNTQVYGAEWAWLPLPLWLALLDPEADERELARLVREWGARRQTHSNSAHARGDARRTRRALPVLVNRQS
ncbi:MAG TPA: hypothetical protein VFX96_00015 [Pyrinomonadaceae bacterium]|nr:hypothetical protein [Pyrinomonadaceae bacterium]